MIVWGEEEGNEDGGLLHKAGKCQRRTREFIRRWKLIWRLTSGTFNSPRGQTSTSFLQIRCDRGRKKKWWKGGFLCTRGLLRVDSLLRDNWNKRGKRRRGSAAFAPWVVTCAPIVRQIFHCQNSSQLDDLQLTRARGLQFSAVSA